MPAAVENWVVLKDFRQGIKSRTGPATSVTQRMGEALGVADAKNTWRCWALPDGSLAPMPDITSGVSFGGSTPFNPINLSSGRLSIGGMLPSGPIQTGYEVHVAFEGVKTGSPKKRCWFWTRYRNFSPGSGTVDTLMSKNPTTIEPDPTVDDVRPTWFANYRAHATDATQPGTPGVVCAWFSGGGGQDRVFHMFPGPSTSTSDTPQSITGTLDPYPMFTHQGRVVALDQGSYNHGAGGIVWTHNEDMWFTKANLTALDVSAAQTLGMENATGYRAAISYSHQELLMVKDSGGGLLVRGDLKSPTVLRLPAMPRVGLHIPAVTPLGVVLMDARYSGAWLWNGGESAENISRDALTGDLMYLGARGVTAPDGGTTDQIDYEGQLCFWYNWVLFPNNWAWDWQQNAWWRIENPNTVRFMHYSTILQWLYAAPAQITATTDNVFYSALYETAASSYRWKGLPIATQSPNTDVTIREIVCVATGSGTVTLTFTNADASTEAHSFVFTSNTTPQFFRDQASVTCQAIRLQIDVTASGSGQATPIVHEIRMGMSPSRHYPSRVA